MFFLIKQYIKNVCSVDPNAWRNAMLGHFYCVWNIQQKRTISKNKPCAIGQRFSFFNFGVLNFWSPTLSVYILHILRQFLRKFYVFYIEMLVSFQSPSFPCSELRTLHSFLSFCHGFLNSHGI